MKFQLHQVRTWLLLAFLLSLPYGLHAQETAAADKGTSATATAQETENPAAGAEKTQAADSASATTPEPSPTVEAPAAPAAPASPEAPEAPEVSDNKAASQAEMNSDDKSGAQLEKPAKPAKDKSAKGLKKEKKDNGKVRVQQSGGLGPVVVNKNEVTDEAVSVMGSVNVDGEVRRDAVSILGNTTINGVVRQNAVAILGNITVNGEVFGDVVSITGNVHLGPNAVVHGKGVTILGRVIREEGSQINGVETVFGSGNGFAELGSFGTWFQECLLKGRLLAFDSSLSLFWGIAAIHLAFYLILALILRKATTRCASVLEESPGMSLLSAFLAFLLTPLVVILLAITGIGAVLIPFLVLGLFALGVFGRVVILASIGRLATLRQPIGGSMAVVLHVLIGGLLVTLLYCIPIFGLLLHWLLGTLGLGVVVYALCQGMRRNGKPAASAVPPVSQVAKPAVPVAPVPPASPSPASFAPRGAEPAQAAAIVSAPSISVPPAPAPSFTIQDGVPVPSSAPTPAPTPIEAALIPPVVPLVQPPPPVLPPEPPSAPIPPTPSAPEAMPAALVSQPAAARPPVSQFGASPTPDNVVDATLPRAGFWLRMGALAIDMVLVFSSCGFLIGMMPGFLHISFGPWVFLMLAIYGGCLWHLRGTTIGGIICRIQVVRTDGRPLDNTTCAVRAMGCVLSGFACGLGFLWIAIDDENEAWHDKISGTTVVIVPKSRPLV